MDCETSQDGIDSYSHQDDSYSNTHENGSDSLTHHGDIDCETHHDSSDSYSKPHQDSCGTRIGPMDGIEGDHDAQMELMGKEVIASNARDEDAICHLCRIQKEDGLNNQGVDGRTVIMLAAGRGHIACLRILLHHSRMLINVRDIEGQTALMIAAAQGHSECVTCLLSAPEIDVNLRDEEGRTALLLASERGHLECVQSLLDFSKLVMSSSDWKKEIKLAFLLAVKKGQTDCVRHFMEASTTQTAKECNSDFGSAIVSAIRRDHFECLKYFVDLTKLKSELSRRTYAFTMDRQSEFYLLPQDLPWETHALEEIFLINQAEDVDIYSQDTMSLVTELLCQIYSDIQILPTMLWFTAAVLYIPMPTECIFCLSKTGEPYSISIFDCCTIDTAVALAVVNSHFDCVKQLTVKQVGLRANNWTQYLSEMSVVPFVIAAIKGKTDILKYFLETCMAIVDVDLRQSVTTNLLLLASVNGHAECVKCVLDTGQADVIHSNGQRTALMFSAEYGHVECVKYILDSGKPDVNYWDSFRYTAFLLSAKNGHVECLKFLFDTGKIDLNQCNRYGDNALMLSAKEGHVDCVEYLLGTGQADIIHSNGQRTALMLSAENGHVECVKYMLDSGKIDINYCDTFRYTAFLLAAKNGHVECLKCLFDTGKIDINHKSKTGLSAIVLSVGHYDHNKGLKYILDSGKVDVDDKILAIEEALDRKDSMCLSLLLQHIPNDQPVWDHMKTIFLEHSHKSTEAFYVCFFLEAGFFSWSWYPEFSPNKLRFLTRELVTNGYVPKEFERNGITSSPLRHAFMVDDGGLVRYLIANFYLTHFDVKHFQKDTTLQSQVSLNGSKSVKELHQQMFHSPWRLEALSLLTISVFLRKDRWGHDENAFDGLLPGYYQRLIAFRTPIRWLNENRWETIDVNLLLNGRISTKSLGVAGNDLVAGT